MITVLQFYVLDDNDEKVVVKIILQVPWIMMFINDKKINGNVSGFMDPESHAPNRALQWQRHLHLRLQGLLLASLVNDDDGQGHVDGHDNNHVDDGNVTFTSDSRVCRFFHTNIC